MTWRTDGVLAIQKMPETLENKGEMINYETWYRRTAQCRQVHPV